MLKEPLCGYNSQYLAAGAKMRLNEPWRCCRSKDVAAGVKMCLQEKLFESSFLRFCCDFLLLSESRSFEAALLGIPFARSQFNFFFPLM